NVTAPIDDGVAREAEVIGPLVFVIAPALSSPELTRRERRMSTGTEVDPSAERLFRVLVIACGEKVDGNKANFGARGNGAIGRKGERGLSVQSNWHYEVRRLRIDSNNVHSVKCRCQS